MQRLVVWRLIDFLKIGAHDYAIVIIYGEVMCIKQFVNIRRQADAVVEGAQLALGEWLDVASFDQGA